MDYEDCILELRNHKIVVDSKGLGMIVKQIPETKEEGFVDPRQKEFTIKCMSNDEIKIKNPLNASIKEILDVRSAMGCINIDLSNKVEVSKTKIASIPVEIYSKKGNKEKSPVVVYIHGGGFVGGTIDVVRNSCKLLSDRSDSTVISIDYSLSPENKFPQAVNECYRIIKEIKKKEESLKVDSNRLIVMGDSAGANLAAACCVCDKENLIRLQVLLYPVLDISYENIEWSDEIYTIKKDKEVSKALIYEVKNMMSFFTNCYINNDSDIENILASPLKVDDLSIFPLTMIVSPEYDYLRKQAEDFAHNLQENGVDVIFYRYKGMGHAFFEHTGEFPQAEDCINEISEAIRAL